MRDSQGGAGRRHFLRGYRVGTSLNAPRALDLGDRRELPRSTARQEQRGLKRILPTEGWAPLGGRGWAGTKVCESCAKFRSKC